MSTSSDLDLLLRDLVEQHGRRMVGTAFGRALANDAKIRHRVFGPLIEIKETLEHVDRVTMEAFYGRSQAAHRTKRVVKRKLPARSARRASR